MNSATRFHQFKIDKKVIGIVPDNVYDELIKYKGVFEKVDITNVTFCNHIISPEDKTFGITTVVKDLKQQEKFECLKGWRNEEFSISAEFGEPPLFNLERSACHLFGFAQYGAHLNGYVRNNEGNILMWIGKRSDSKSTWPGCLDNMVGGGIAAGDTVWKTLVKECQEEASLPIDLINKAQSSGTISYWLENRLGLSYDVEFVYDLEVPMDFVPVNADGEMSGFQLMTMEEIKISIFEGRFKPNCALVVLDFMIRHGLITPDEDKNYCQFITSLHEPFEKMIRFSKP